MNVMIYYTKKNFDVQKAERYFKERGVSVRLVDMKKNKPGLREMQLFARQVGLGALIDRESTAWLESTARFLSGEEAILEALCANPAFVKGPIVRNGNQAASGFQPDVFALWK